MGVFTRTDSLRNAHLAAPDRRGVDSRAIAATLRWADTAAARHDYEEALHWLDTVAAICDELPAGYAVKRAAWQDASRTRHNPWPRRPSSHVLLRVSGSTRTTNGPLVVRAERRDRAGDG